MADTAQTPASLAGKKVLIVEDDTFLHGLLAGKLKSLNERGVTLLSATTSDEVLKIAHEAHPDIILLDIVLPGGSGLDLLASLRGEAAFKQTPVVVLSNLSQDADRKRAEELGVASYFVKSDFPLDTIAERVVKILEKSA